jgi:hypothetical protein
VVTLLAAGLALSACAGGLQPASAPGAGSAPGNSGAPASGSSPAAASAPSDDGASAAASAPANVPRRDLSEAEKKVIMDAVQYNIQDPKTARYHWTKLAVTGDDSGNYCATVDAKSPYAPYNGRQAYILNVKLANGQVVSANMALIAGGKDAAIVVKECAKYDLDPNG